MARYPGKNVRLFLSSFGGTGVATPVLGISAINVERTADLYDVTAGGDSNIQEVQGFDRYNITFEGAWDDTETKLALAAASANGANFIAYPDYTNIPAKLVSGPCRVQYSVSMPSQDAVRVSGRISANGTINWAL